MDEEDFFGEEYFPVDPDEEILDVPIDMEGDDLPASPKKLDIDPRQEEPPPPPVVEEDPLVQDDIIPLSSPPEDASNFFAVTSSHSSRMYLRTRTATTPSQSSSGRSFLERPIQDLIAMSAEYSAKRDQQLAQWLQITSANVTGDTRQYVDKYKPMRFIDLLSDDALNKHMLSWLSEWRKNSLHPSNSITISAPAIPISADPQNRKVLLIGGGPGVGKSALIDVCCRHFKYAVVESNAADERGRAAIQKTITDVCGNRSVIDSSKPQILVIEEVDGEECAAADVLVDILTKHPEMIKRPVICVCSDVYKKSMKGLRELSTVITMSQPKQLRLSEKLKSICQQEKLKIESLAVDRLIQICECDIRSCLNQLQALASRLGAKEGETIRVADVAKYVGNDGNSRSADAAVKDNHKSEFELIQLLFEPKRSRGPKYKDQVAVAISTAKSLPYSLGDVFAHCFLTIPFTDANLRYTSTLIELMALTDTGVMAHGGWELPMRFASHWCAAIGKPRIDILGARNLISARYSRHADRDAVTAALVKSSLHSARAARTLIACKSAWGLYVTRLLLFAMSPEHNPVWVKKGNFVHPDIERISNIYAQFGVELVKESNHGDITAPDRHIYVMRPNLRILSELESDGAVADAAIPFFPVGSPMGELLRATVHTQLTKAVSGQEASVQMIARGSKRSIAPQVDEDDTGLAKKSKTVISLSSWASNKSSTNSGDGARGQIVVKKFPFEFRFNEGHTNAVKRVLRLKDFLVSRHI